MGVTPDEKQAEMNKIKDEEIDLSDLPEIPSEKFVRAILRKALQPVARKPFSDH
jgi:hypothetical protein